MRTTSILGLLMALYLITDGVAAGDGLSAPSWAVAVGAILMTLIPMGRARSLILEEATGARRVGALSVITGLLLATSLGPPSLSMARELTAAVLLPIGGMLILDLSFFLPDIAAERRLRGPLVLTAVAAAGAGLANILPAFELMGTLWVAPSSFAFAPALFALGAIALALLIRLRRRFWSAPASRASNGWAVLGLAPSLGLGLFVLYTLRYEGLPPRIDAFRLAAFGTSGWLLYSHVALIDPRRRLAASATTRELLALLPPMALCVGLVVWAAPQIPARHTALASWGGTVIFIGVWWTLRPFLLRLFSPDGGRLLRAIRQARHDLATTGDLQEIGQAVLGPLRNATLRGEFVEAPTTRLLTLAPPRAVRIDAAGTAKVVRGEVPDAIEQRLAETPGELMLRDALAAQVVRQPALRPVLAVLETEGALCGVPLGLGDEIEGVLFVPAGDRRTPLALEELEALRTLGQELGTRLSLLGGRDRALGRVGEMNSQLDRVTEETQGLVEEVRRLKFDARAFRAGRGRARQEGQTITYSAAMQQFRAALENAAPIPAPGSFVAEAGIAVDRVAQQLHRRSGRAAGSFVVADASSVRAADAGPRLFGDENQAGWLQLAAGGTLLLADVAALPLELQRELHASMAARQARPVDGGGYYPLDVRLVATTRRPLDALVEDGALDPELARYLGGLSLTIPPLRERREDIPSLVLLALDRACRVLGHAPVGISGPALDALCHYHWPGNLRELQHIVDRAVARCGASEQVQRDHLPALAAPDAQCAPDPLEGTYAEVEARVLARAMRISEGNKSEAARILGLKRTTFLDKLRRQQGSGDGAEKTSTPQRTKKPRGKRTRSPRSKTAPPTETE